PVLGRHIVEPIDVVLFEVRQDLVGPARGLQVGPVRSTTLLRGVRNTLLPIAASGWEPPVDIVERMHRQADLFQIVATTDAVGRLTCFLNRREQKADEDCDDRDYDEQLDEGEPEGG